MIYEKVQIVRAETFSSFKERKIRACISRNADPINSQKVRIPPQNSGSALFQGVSVGQRLVLEAPTPRKQSKPIRLNIIACPGWLVEHFRTPDVMASYQNSVYFGALRERGCLREKNYDYESPSECGSSLDPYPSHSWGFAAK
ncbi:hypothetical protein NPIL_200031 [Nephila pilipes]|uniref:Uncharacterized protein n=1 Tax=Nephila pilipes TaxID=299642 RepID=A0A8X6MWN7_NEPPI|nr:hypothetical protein NPIL_200031 [Nephila pilipes]